MKTEKISFEKYTPDQQGAGSFDGGKITEIKPIPFPHEPGGSGRAGPLLYWAWASANGDGIIGMHPHKGFEIVSYVLEGTVGHTDTAGNNRRVGKGGIQIMQTGSGISHQEEMYGDKTDFFQIWFEPNLSKTLKQKPAYKDIDANAFPIGQLDTNVSLKHIIGPRGAAQLQTPIQWDELNFGENGLYETELEEGGLAAMMIASGEVEVTVEAQSKTLTARDFALIETNQTNTLSVAAATDSAQVALITGPIDPGYPLYRF